MTDEVRFALRAAAGYLRRREYSELELREKLYAKHPRDYADEAVSLLVEAGLVSDKRAIEATIHRLSERKIVGDAEIRVKLEKLGIGWEEANSIIGTQISPEIERAKELVSKKFDSESSPAKIGRFLYSRGFDESTIESVLENLPWADTE